MVYTSGGGLRFFVQAASVCVIGLSVIPTAQPLASNVDSGSGSVVEELVGDCEISDGDKAFGIQGVIDIACATGGLGCYNDHCRYCKVIDTLKSAHLESCESLGASFPSMAPLKVSTEACHVSSGDAAVGVGGMTDPSCLYGGIGCFNDHCRFCQSKPTPQSSHFLLCSWVENSSRSAESLEGSAGDAGLDRVLSSESTAATGTSSVCSMTASDGDVAVGINIITDVTCASGGSGCIDNICRFCKTKDTTQSAHFTACPAVATKTCTTPVSSGDAAVGINIVTDASCAQGGLGCIDSVCRFCRTTSTAQSSTFVDCALIGTQTPVTTTTPVVTTPAPTPAPTPVPTTAAKQSCSETVSDGDAAVGIKIVTDSSCSSGGLGCIDQICRFCRVTTTAQSASFVDCATIAGTPTTAAPATTPAPTKTPALTTVAPTKMPAPTSAPSTTICTIIAAAGDVDAGINIVTDTTCASGGLGCIDNVCRFCRVSSSTQSSGYVDCAAITGTTTQTLPTSAPTPAPTPSTKVASPAIVFECSRTISSGDKAVGLDIASDIRCSEGGTGCLDEVCRFCKRFDTVQSQSYVDCSTIPSSDIGFDISFVPIPVVDSDAPTRMLAADSPSSLDASSRPDASDSSYEGSAASVCTMAVSSGDAAVGINIVTDTSCSSGGTGCIDTICRYCKTKDTDQSAHLSSCPSTTAAPLTTTKTCMTSVSDGDASVGINIITDTSCAIGGLGCIDSICRYCKTKSTDQSTHFGSCSDYSSTTSSPATSAPASTAPPATFAPAVTTSPTSTTTYSIPMDCYQTVSNGDKNLGLDIVTDMRCGDGGVGCVDSICRFCKRFETPQSHSYMNCSDIPASYTGADITFKPILQDDTMESSAAERIVGLHESEEFTAVETDGICANVSLADGQSAGGIGVVLDTVNCPEGLASGCIGSEGCRYCMRFPTNVSEYLEYCAIVNSTGVAYPLTGVSPSMGDGSTHSADAGTAGSLSAETGNSISAETRSSDAGAPTFVKSGIIQWIAVAAGCAGVVIVVALAGIGINRTIKNLAGRNARSSDNEKVSPEDENRTSVLVASNVGEPGIISDV
ncbi:hypothetical protein PPTG_14777 [Phytophthora nicotianae INRA-310]|uniref:Uncharacterized protein n=2 Tax=Phytophthora nicotianae TaxID=4792 RepID=W2PVV6_PHYN3|nr:hypothetical protein PPTG_14777 [Phytophthora nicotianae INRA-310]ETN05098.1 hypothetical protein PPTG_14777 [Phytophthora nicotianae INRA-310]